MALMIRHIDLIYLLVSLLIIVICVKSDLERYYTNSFVIKVHEKYDSEEVIIKLAEKYGFIYSGKINPFDGYYILESPRVEKRSASIHHKSHQQLLSEPMIKSVEQQYAKIRVKRELLDSPSDPLYKDQWYLHGGGNNGNDLRVVEAWKKGYTGKGIVISILDDGILHTHPDLKLNYDPLASYDLNSNDSDPTPQENGNNKHGTRCAGEVAAEMGNNICGVGIAFNSSIGGIRMLDGTVTDFIESRALSFNPSHIDIYSASWGPADDGATIDGPGTLASLAFIEGVKKGRNGKGSIFIWASGNGGKDDDNCNCDGYTNSIYTLSISSATQSGTRPWYLEQCSSTLAATYSSGSRADMSVVTVDMSLDPSYLCTLNHSGTSASAPLAAGIVALALEANNKLTWRDMQHLVVRTSRSEPLNQGFYRDFENQWETNGVGRKYSHSFGYGLMDALGMVELAEKWVTVGEQNACFAKFKFIKKRKIIKNKKLTLKGADTNLKEKNFRNEFISLLGKYMQSNTTFDGEDEDLEKKFNELNEDADSNGNDKFFETLSMSSYEFNIPEIPEYLDFTFSYPNCLPPVNYLEHVIATVKCEYFPRGNLKIILISPSGTISQLLAPRWRDTKEKFLDWSLMSVHFWGESPKGEWRLLITSVGEGHGSLFNVELTFLGTKEPPYGEKRHISDDVDEIMSTNKIRDDDNNEIITTTMSDIETETTNTTLLPKNDSFECLGNLYENPYNHKCEENCPNGFYADISSHKCLLCHNDCFTCKGEKRSDCLSCLEPAFNDKGRCVICCKEDKDSHMLKSLIASPEEKDDEHIMTISKVYECCKCFAKTNSCITNSDETDVLLKRIETEIPYVIKILTMFGGILFVFLVFCILNTKRPRGYTQVSYGEKKDEFVVDKC